MKTERKMATVTLLVFALLSACSFYGLPGIASIPRSVKRPVRYGIEHDVPRAVGIQYLRGDVYAGLYWSPFDVSYSWDRVRAFGASFQVRFPRNPFTDGTFAVMDRNTVELFISTWPDASPHELVDVDVQDDLRFGQNGFHFIYTTRATNPGNSDFINIREGYIFPHPYDVEYLVILSIGDFFDPARGGKPDPTLREIAEEWFSSIRIEAPSEEENAYMRRRYWKWVPLDGKIPQ